MADYDANNPLSTAPANVVTIMTVGAGNANVIAAALNQPAGTLIFVAGDPSAPPAATDKSLYIVLPDFAASPAANTMRAYQISGGAVPLPVIV